MALKTDVNVRANNGIVTAESLKIKRHDLLSFYIKQLENAIFEAKKSTLFKTNLLKWAIKADNLQMALNQSQFLILKSNEIEMLNTVYKLVTIWAENVQNLLQEQYEAKVVGLLKTALILIEDVPNSASFDAFKRLVQVLDNVGEESFNSFRPITLEETDKMNFVKKFIKETCNESSLPKGMLQMVLEDESFPMVIHSVGQIPDTENNFFVSHSPQESVFSDVNKVLPVVENSIVPLVAKSLSSKPMSNESLQKDDIRPAAKPKIKYQNISNLSAGHRSFDQLDKNSVMVEPNTEALSQDPQTMRAAVLTLSKMRGRFYSTGTGDIRSTGGMETQNVTPIIPWYYQRLTQVHREPNAQESVHSPVHKTGTYEIQDTQVIEEPVCAPCVDQSRSPHSSLSNTSPIYYKVNAENQRCSSSVKLRCSPSESKASEETSNIIERMIEVQHRGSTTPPFVAAERFPPLSLIPQLCQQESEPMGAWIDRLGDQLKKYLKPSNYEYDVILRWILSCGSIREANSSESSLKSSAEQLVAQLIGQDDGNDSKRDSVATEPPK